jgi:hypothetical protein
MKNTKKLFGIVPIVMTIGFLAVSCLTYENVNTSLNGVWSRGDIVITITDSNGVFTQINSSSNWQQVLNNGYIRIGDTYLRNITRTGNLRWAGQILSYNSGEYTLSGWRDFTISMDSRGKTLQIMVNNVEANFINQATTYTRIQ